jgi:hypothetical protein
MAGYRSFPPEYQFCNDEGIPLAGGSLTYSITGTPTAKNVYSDTAATVSLGNVLTLDTAGRAPDHFLSGEYRRILKDADGDQVTLFDNIRDVASGSVAPLDPADGNDLDVYSTDGVSAYWRALRELPDPTGSDGYMVVADGDGYSLQAPITADSFDADNLPGGISATASASGSVVVGNVRIQWGADTAPSTGTLHSTKAVTFGTAFSGSPYFVGVTPGASSSTGEGAGASAQYTSPSTTGFTASFFVGAEDNGGVAEINTTIPFTYIAIGPA